MFVKIQKHIYKYVYSVLKNYDNLNEDMNKQNEVYSYFSKIYSFYGHCFIMNSTIVLEAVHNTPHSTESPGPRPGA